MTQSSDTIFAARRASLERLRPALSRTLSDALAAKIAYEVRALADIRQARANDCAAQKAVHGTLRGEFFIKRPFVARS